MTKSTFTENQKKAHDYTRNIALLANAGSGKTTVLAHRFLSILLNTDTNIDELVAITFTDKAAGELKTKIASLLDYFINNSNDQTIKSKCKNIRAHFSSANISTIHSFCAKILRLNPVEANVDVAFNILEGIDKEILINEAINETISEILKDSSNEFQQELITLLRDLNKKNLLFIIDYMIKKRERVDRLISNNGLYLKTDEYILNFWEKSLIDYVIHELNPQKLISLIKSIDLLRDQNVIIDQLNSLSLANSTEILNVLLATDEMLNNLLKVRSKTKLLNFTDLDKIRNYRNKINSLKEILNNFENNSEVLKYTRSILKLYDLTLKKYEEAKLEKSYLDYDDLQLKTREVLKNIEVKNFLANKYKYIMIDEYQDTNFLQYEIFLPLLNDLKQGNLFIVGDPKQSIFGFRNAEVEVFEKTITDITKNSDGTRDLIYQGEFISSSQEEKHGKIVLNENFRLLTDIVAFVNLLFRNLMGNVEYEFEVSYQELIKGRNNPEKGCVELLLNILEDEKTDSEEEDTTSDDAEYEMLAQKILKLKAEEYPIYESSKTSNSEEIKRAFDFGDAAILLRSRTYLKKLEYWLNKYRIPYLISGGIGFYQTQEIYDFYNYFQFLLNNQDEVALVGILRSPFFSISDTELFEIAIQDKKDIGFWIKVQNYAKTERASRNLKRAVAILSDNIKYAARVPIQILVQKIFRQTAWIGTIAGLQRGEQSKLNIHKLLNIAREFEGKGFTNLFDFVERLKALIEQEVREGQARVSKDSKAVNILTIHSAKGLEFPVVFIPFLHKSIKFDNGPFIDTKYGIGFKITSGDRNKENNPIYNFLKMRSRQKTIAEEKRLLYVACTRARDLLILSGTVKNKPRKIPNYLEWIISALNINDFNIKSVSFPKQKLKSIVYRDNKYVPIEFEHDLNIQITNSLAQLGTPDYLTKEKPEPLPIKNILTQNIPAYLKNNFYSATQIQTFYTCSMKYFLKYQLGFLKDEPLHALHEEAEPNDKLNSEEIGLGLHKVLELFNEYSEESIKDFLSNYFSLGFFNKQTDIEKNIINVLFHVRNYFNSNIYREISKYKDYKNEFTINSKFGENFITGTIDKLVKDENGNWFIVDYKTDKVASDDDLNRQATKYFYQIGFYALLVNKMFQQKNIEAILIFTNKVDNNFIRIRFSPHDLEKIEKSIEKAINNIANNSFSMNEQACEYCQYHRYGKCIGEHILKIS